MNSYISHDDIIVIDLLDEVDDVIVSVGNCQGLAQMHEGAEEQFVRVRHNAWNNSFYRSQIPKIYNHTC